MTSLNPRYNRIHCGLQNYYYEPIELSINVTGTVRVYATSDIHLCGYLYKERFDPFNAKKFLFEGDRCDLQINMELQAVLQANIPHILIVTTFNEDEIGEFHLVASGLTPVTINRISRS